MSDCSKDLYDVRSTGARKWWFIAEVLGAPGAENGKNQTYISFSSLRFLLASPDSPGPGKLEKTKRTEKNKTNRKKQKNRKKKKQKTEKDKINRKKQKKKQKKTNDTCAWTPNRVSRYLSLGTWERAILECWVMQSELRYLGLGTWERKILEYKVMHFGLGTWV